MTSTNETTETTGYRVYLDYMGHGGESPMWGFSLRIDAADKEQAAALGVAQAAEAAKTKNDKLRAYPPEQTPPSGWLFQSEAPADYRVRKVVKRATRG